LLFLGLLLLPLTTLDFPPAFFNFCLWVMIRTTNTIIITKKIKPTSQSESHHHTIIIPVHHLLLIDYSILKRLRSMFTKIRQCKTYLVTYFFLKFIWFIDLFWGKKKVNM
jgi:hypothetical protein